ncbi:hypothetical protein CW304_01425 [Bacillus sp. UFRGS-B20]|nr:hypothetical protein CW304_01425 [Bacillus sp. UFRGS-B20]
MIIPGDGIVMTIMYMMTSTGWDFVNNNSSVYDEQKISHGITWIAGYNRSLQKYYWFVGVHTSLK